MKETGGVSKKAKRVGVAGLFAALATSASFAGANLLSSLLRNKGLAVLLEPSGFGQWSQIMTFFYLLQTAAVLGVTTGVARYVAQYRREGKDPGQVLTSAIMLVGGLGLGLGLIVVLLSPWLGGWIVGRSGWWWVMLAVGAAVPLVSLQAIFRAGLQGYEDFKRLSAVTAAGAFGSLAVAIVAAYYIGARGVAFFVLASFGITSFFFLRGLRRHVGFKLIGRMDWGLAKGVMAYGGVALLGSVFAAVGNLAARTMLLHQYGPEQNGYYQAMSGITLQVLPVFLSGIGLYVIPKLGGVDDRSETLLVLRKVIRIIMLVVTPLLALGMVFRELFFTIVFTDAFLHGAVWFPVQLTGDLFLALAWASGAHFLPTGKLRIFVLCESVRAVGFLGVSAALLHYGTAGSGVGALSIAHLASYGLQAVLFLSLDRRLLKLPMGRLSFIFLLVGLAWLAVLMATYSYSPLWRLAVWAIVMPGIWIAGLQKEEWSSVFSLVRRAFVRIGLLRA